ncbi:hypothetical protein OIV83_000677 [Microbotryomycetes sp. JL201]|nr:hypothetical protein OIV83_000677 [Microbotryomycetes sp. JL201]
MGPADDAMMAPPPDGATTQPQVAVANAAGISQGGTAGNLGHSTGTARIVASGPQPMSASINQAHGTLPGSVDVSKADSVNGTTALGNNQNGRFLPNTVSDGHSAAPLLHPATRAHATQPGSGVLLGRTPSSRRYQVQFPILPASQPAPDQTFQTPTQVSSILSLPPSLLVNLARTASPEEQQAIASKAQAQSYLSSMALPPPSPTTLTGAMSSVMANGSMPAQMPASIGDHPAIPILLGQAFSPPVPGIIAPATDQAKVFEPTYASVEDWSYQAAREHVELAQANKAAEGPSAPTSPSLPRSQSFNEKEIASVADQLAKWALQEQEQQVEEQVLVNKEAAVILAAQAAVRRHIVKASSTAVTSPPTSGLSESDLQTAAAIVQGLPEGAAALENAASKVDLSAYARTYREQLNALACGYFAQLHREAIKRLAVNADLGATSPKLDQGVGLTGQSYPGSSAPPSRRGSADGTARSRTSTPSLPTTAPTLGLPTPTMESLTDVAGREQAEAMHVQAAAAAAVAANAMAAKELATKASTTLQMMGVDMPQLVPKLALEQPKGGLPSLELPPQAIAIAQNPAATESNLSGAWTHNNNAGSSEQPQSAGAARAQLVAHQQQQPIQPQAQTLSPPIEVKVFLTHPETTTLHTPEKRDYMLSYAHTVYSRNPRSPELLPLLHTLEQVHPDHLPTLLLMSCVYYTRGELESSLYYNKRLLSKDPNYVEAMSNIGTTLRAMGRWKEAEQWWFKAIKMRPTYWDATENLLGVLCNPTPPTNAISTDQEPPPTAPRYHEALALCEFVEAQVFASEVRSDGQAHETPFMPPLANVVRPLRLPDCIPCTHVNRLQNLFYAKGNLRTALGDSAGAKDEYEKAVELALSFPAWTHNDLKSRIQMPLMGLSVRDLVVTTVVLAKILAANEQFGAADEQGYVAKLVKELGLADASGRLTFTRAFAVVQSGGDDFLGNLLAQGGGFLPTVLLRPQQLDKLHYMMLSETGGMLPAIFDARLYGVPSSKLDPVHAQAKASTGQTTSTMLLTLAKILQDNIGTASNISLGGIPPSSSLLLPLYYLALTFYRSPSTCNNLGILLSSINATAIVQAEQPGHPPLMLTGQTLAHLYYEMGLHLDPKHPHLYTNLGSLLKDLGQLPQAVAMYKRAVDCKPDFDVALANLANAVKDMGQIQESIPFYRRAVSINPNFPEAICGLVNALGGVCDWQGRGGVDELEVVDNQNQLVPVSATGGGAARTGYMGQIANLVDKQLNDGLNYGIGSVRQVASADGWIALIARAIYNKSPADIPSHKLESWRQKLALMCSDIPMDTRLAVCINEGGFLIRLVERLMRRIQRRWFLDVYGQDTASEVHTQRTAVGPDDVRKYGRPLLPQSLPLVPVPTVLPFHCFTLSVGARATRLISHRTGLRISHSTLMQPWMPSHVYPPPRPPANGKLNIGYVSSDLGNHPLSHLMQSVFGFHDLSKFNVFCYATSPTDNSAYRIKIEAEAQHFVDVSSASTQQIVERVVSDEIHILINLSGYTKGARNEVFAARPAPVQMSYMGFAGTLAAGWCDYFIVDPVVCPPDLVSGVRWRQQAGHVTENSTKQQNGHSYMEQPTDFEGDPDPESKRDDFVYTEKLIYMPHSYFVTDHKQAWKEDPNAFVLPNEVPIADDGTDATRWAIEESKRWKMRRAIFPNLADDAVIFANWNQLYKIDPVIFRAWLNILQRVPNSILWLLRFPAPGEAHLRATATKWAGPAVAERIVFTDVANKADHIHRGRVADLFLDTTECNAHTTAADILWSGTPLLTFPRHRHKMASRVAASIALATGLGDQMIVNSVEQYETRAIALASSLSYEMQPPTPGADLASPEARQQRKSRGELADLRKRLFLSRDQSPLFDTKRWVVNFERGLVEAWQRWVSGAEFEGKFLGYFVIARL